jgi:hypothetical protein
MHEWPQCEQEGAGAATVSGALRHCARPLPPHRARAAQPQPTHPKRYLQPLRRLCRRRVLYSPPSRRERQRRTTSQPSRAGRSGEALGRARLLVPRAGAWGRTRGSQRRSRPSATPMAEEDPRERARAHRPIDPSPTPTRSPRARAEFRAVGSCAGGASATVARFAPWDRRGIARARKWVEGMRTGRGTQESERQGRS